MAARFEYMSKHNIRAAVPSIVSYQLDIVCPNARILLLYNSLITPDDDWLWVR